MKFDLSIPTDYKAFELYSFKLIEDAAKVELKRVNPPRSLNQNKYLHVVINLYAIAYGQSSHEAKTDLKRDFGMVYVSKGKRYLKSTADLDTKQMTEFIEWIRNRAAKELAYYIPTSEEYLLDSFAIDKEIERFKTHL
jgi:hypothetical protein